MPSLNKAERDDHRAWLSDWRTPAGMAAHLDKVNDAMGSSSFLHQPGVEFLRDAWQAAEFGRHRRSSFVRLIPERDLWPDSEARDGDNNIERVECAEADIPDRRRGDEYREAEQRMAEDGFFVEHDPEGWIASADQAVAVLSRRVASKVAKRYDGSASLLIYLNISGPGIRRSQIERVLEPYMAPALPHFQRVWILWQDLLYGPWTADSAKAISLK